MNRSFHIVTLGCKVNQYESDALRESLEKEGYVYESDFSKAHLYIVNTCTVTNESGRKSRQMIRKVKKVNPDVKVVAVGCLVDEKNSDIPQMVDLVLGNRNKHQLVRWLKQQETPILEDINEQKSFQEQGISTTGQRTRAYMKIQDGCNHYCSYCIIPFVRGRVRSRSLEHIKEEALRLAQNHVKEVVLTGIHLDSYGLDLENTDLADAVLCLDEVEGIQRVRLSSLDPKSVNETFVEKISSSKKLCPHFHLSLQSGSDQVLKGMDRRYTTSDFEKAKKLLEKSFREASFTTDVIVGFPGETQKAFMESMDFVEKMQFLKVHVFPFSPKKGTKAYQMDDQISGNIKKQRVRSMMEVSLRARERYLQKSIHSIQPVLVENLSKTHQDQAEGYTPNYIRVIFDAHPSVINSVQNVKLEKILGEVVTGSLQVPPNV